MRRFFRLKSELQPNQIFYFFMQKLDFSNTEIAFSSKSNRELKKTAWLFGMMNKQWLVNIGSKFGLFAVKWSLPFAETVVKKTIFEQFVGGTSLEDTKAAIDKLAQFQTETVLDYGAEAKESEEDFEKTKNEFIKAIRFGAASQSVPVVSIKVTGMARFELLEKIHAKQTLSEEEKTEFEIVKNRVDEVCKCAFEHKIAVFVDAEETWIQDPIDDIVEDMMEKYNREKICVYNTYQLYISFKLDYLYASFERAKKGNYILGAKLVRGAYMEKEGKRAAELGYPNPINPTKKATDEMYNKGIVFCVENHEKIASCCASHNQESSRLQAELIENQGIAKNHPHLSFCQLYGMSDNLTFNLSANGFSASKYMPYGTVKDVIPYLIRRAQENSSVSGDMGREYKLIADEVKRRKL
jgi:proline dehydrogenase